MTDHELPPPIGYATHNGMRSLQQDDATVLLYPHDYLIRPDQVPLFTADQMREYGRACEKAAYERAAQWIEGVAATDAGRLLLSQSFIAANLRALGADK